MLLVGQGPERSRLEALANEQGVGRSVTFLGAVADVADVLRAADVFVLPSVAEGMSNSLLEAMATALPCVASDIGGNQDLLGPGGAGVLVAESTPARWAEVLIDLLNDPDQRNRLATAARRRIDDEFALERVVARYVALYRRLLGRDDPSGNDIGPTEGRA